MTIPMMPEQTSTSVKVRLSSFQHSIYHRGYLTVILIITILGIVIIHWSANS